MSNLTAPPVDQDREVCTENSLRAVTGFPDHLARRKVLRALDKHARRFIELSPFLCISSMNTDGEADLSPRGDPPGFVTVLDDNTILIPDRPGNRRMDSMTNFLTNDAVGVLFLVPGIDETLRINGRASITSDPALLEPMAIQGRVPKLAIRVAVDEVFFHCGKAVRRAKLWDPGSWSERSAFPMIGEVIRDQIGTDGRTVEAINEAIEYGYRNNLYEAHPVSLAERLKAQAADHGSTT